MPDVKEIKEYLKKNLMIVTDHRGDRLVISLYLDGDAISSDFIDYSEVVRVVERENEATYN